MKTKPHPTARLRPPPPRPPRRPTPDPLQRAVIERRLYTDFLALAFYPGMRKEPSRAESTAA